MPTNTDTVLGLDVGSRRVGVATASLTARLPNPLTTLDRDDAFFSNLKSIIEKEGANRIVVGLPRNLAGDATGQTEATKDFIKELREQIDLPVHLQDEAVTSRQAEAELEARGKPYNRGDIDALAATYILEDFLSENKGKVS